MNNNDSVLYDVIISGAGPVGLFLACEVALAKCSVLVLEKSDTADSPLKKFPFGMRGLNAPSIEALDRRGLLQEFELHKRFKNPHQTSITEGPRRQVGHFAGIPFLEGNINTSQWKYHLPSSPPASLMTEMAEIETILTRRADSLGVIIKRGEAVTEFRQTENEVTVQTDSHSYKSKWLVGCDGARSSVRKIGRFEFAGTEPEFTGYSAQVDIVNPEVLSPGRVVTDKGMYLQSQPGYINLQDFDKGSFHSSDKPITLEHVQEVFRRISNTDVTISALHMATTWTDRARQATKYRHGRILLAGDAAHIHSPLGGQGLNLGLGDAMNLGWKLAATIHGTAAEGLLDTYQTERQPIGMQVLDWSRAQVAIMSPGPSARALNAIFRDLISTTDGATYFAGRVWGIHTHYDLGEGHPLLGHSVPNFEFNDGVKMNDFLHAGKWISINFDSYPVKNSLGLAELLIRPDGIIAELKKA
ncbi:FAD-dependent monooxygenase [Bdellovibrio sp. HCB185ZH]|uniref:FAD-dependent monooxygenase n=1 Tax=Bdellovibrio sp. HCB185ZH TaxID=3394235 RepID=UPI0039A59FF4